MGQKERNKGRWFELKRIVGEIQESWDARDALSTEMTATIHSAIMRGIYNCDIPCSDDPEYAGFVRWDGTFTDYASGGLTLGVRNLVSGEALNHPDLGATIQRIDRAIAAWNSTQEVRIEEAREVFEALVAVPNSGQHG